MTLVVVGVDGSESSRRALSWALEYAASRKTGTVRCVRAFESPVAWIDVGSEYESAMAERDR